MRQGKWVQWSIRQNLSINSLIPARCGSRVLNLIFKLFLQVDIISIPWEIPLMWMTQKPIEREPTFSVNVLVPSASKPLSEAISPRSMPPRGNNELVAWTISLYINPHSYGPYRTVKLQCSNWITVLSYQPSQLTWRQWCLERKDKLLDVFGSLEIDQRSIIVFIGLYLMSCYFGPLYMKFP